MASRAPRHSPRDTPAKKKPPAQHPLAGLFSSTSVTWLASGELNPSGWLVGSGSTPVVTLCSRYMGRLYRYLAMPECSCDHQSNVGSFTRTGDPPALSTCCSWGP